VYVSAGELEYTGENVFCAAERSRSVTLTPGSAIVPDSESNTEFHLRNSNTTITSMSLITVFLTPNRNSGEEILWQQTVALFDYELEMKRNIENPDGSKTQRMCVSTEKSNGANTPATYDYITSPR
jgi:hypothetical protein